jgi:DNA-binding NtrC family response regulator
LLRRWVHCRHLSGDANRRKSVDSSATKRENPDKKKTPKNRGFFITSVPASPSAREDLTLGAFIRLCLASDDGDQYAQAHRRLDRLFLTRVLEATGGNQHDAARRLGIARETLRRRLRELGLHPTRRSEAEEDEPS